MWHDDNDDIMKLYKLLEEHEFNCPFPAVCPVCGSKSGHIYMHRYDEKHHGGSWVWCSNCHNYSHGSCKVPEWWRNLSNISILKLKHSPDYLESQAELIDSLVNNLLGIPDDKLMKETTYVDPICADQTEYSIILLEGNEPSVEIVRAVNQVSHRNLLKSKELIMNAPLVIFVGDALEVHDMIEILDAGFVEYKIEPDYPYE